MRTEGFAFLLVRSDRQNLPEHGNAVCALHARADMPAKIYQTVLGARCKASPVIRTNKNANRRVRFFVSAFGQAEPARTRQSRVCTARSRGYAGKDMSNRIARSL